MIGTTVSHYRVLERLGAGGMGEVFLAEDLRLHRPVALKMLRPEAHADEAARARLLTEARAASALNHPNIAVVYEIDEADLGQGRVSFIAMEPDRPSPSWPVAASSSWTVSSRSSGRWPRPWPRPTPAGSYTGT